MENGRVEKHIDVLDGVRAIAIIMVVWFHFWQQSWLTPRVTLPKWVVFGLGIKEWNLEGFVRCGYIFVDLLILLSAVCNFYPYARAILLGEDWPDTAVFYRKRLARILPSYLLAVGVMYVIAILENRYSSMGFAIRDLLAHLFFVKTFFQELMAFSPVNAVLWTVQIEVLYYLLMPWIAKAFRRYPIITCVFLWLCTLGSARFFLIRYADTIRYYNNQMFTYAAYYANGMLICMLYIRIRQKELCDRYGQIAAVLLFGGSIWVLNQMVHTLTAADYNYVQVPQIEMRFGMSIVFSVLVLSVMCLPEVLKIAFANPLWRFVSAISYNLYIWHQFLAVKCKEYRLPAWEGEVPPNMTGDRVWMWKYQILILAVSLAVAWLLTYGFERPVAARMKKRWDSKNLAGKGSQK